MSVVDFRNAIVAGDLTSSLLAIRGIDDINTWYVELNNHTPLIYAITNRDWDVVHALLASSVDTNAQNSTGYVALQYAAESCYVRLVKDLLDHGSVPTLHWKGLPFELRLEARTILVLQTMLEYGADINELNTNGETVLFTAIRGKKTKAVNFLLDKGIDIDINNTEGLNIVHVAAIQGYVEGCKLLHKYGIDLNMQSSAGDTPLHYALYYNELDVVTELLDLGVCTDIRNNKGLLAKDVVSNINLQYLFRL